MKKAILIKLMLILIAVAALSYYFITNTARATIHYKVTVTVETPEGFKSGYAVRELSDRAPKKTSYFKPPESGNIAKIRGEAVVVDLGEGGKLFALLRGGRTVRI